MKQPQSSILQRAALTLLMAIMTAATWAAVGDVFTDGNLKYKVTSESPKTVELTGYDGDQPTGTLNIPATVNDYSVTTIGEGAFRDCGRLTSITIPASVTTIGQEAFSNCEYLTSVTFAANSQLATIGESAFFGTGLTSIIIPASVTTIGLNAFEDCSGLTAIYSEIETPFEIGSIASTSVTIIVPVDKRDAYQSKAGWSDYAIVEVGRGGVVGKKIYVDGVYYIVENNIDLGEFVTVTSTNKTGDLEIPNQVTYNGGTYRVNAIGQDAFHGSGLTSITIPASVTTIGERAFTDCYDLTSITFEDISQLSPVGENAFSGCSDLTMTVPVTDLAAFCNNTIVNQIRQKIGIPVKLVDGEGTEITSYVIPSGVTSISAGAFSNCTGLTSVTIPASVTTIGWAAFNGCSGLTSVTFAANSQLTTVGDNVFAGCYALTVTVPVTDLAAFCNNTIVNQIWQKIGKPVKLVDGEGTEITSYVIPSGVTSLGYYVFYNCTGLTSVSFPASVTTIGESAFSGCFGLTSVTFAENSQLTTIGKEAFEDTGLTSITIPASVMTIGERAFYSCTDLTSVTIPTSVTTIGNDAFTGCSALPNVKVSVTDLAAFCNNTIVYQIGQKIIGPPVKLIDGEGTEITSYVIPSGVTSIGEWAFLNCRGLTSVTIPNSVTIIGDYAFQSCKDLTSVAIPNSVTTLGFRSFVGCGLTSVTIPGSVTTIGKQAFADCADLTSVIISEGVTTIDEEAFLRCISLASVSLPDGLTTIWSDAFYYCDALTSIAIPASVTTIGGYALKPCTSVTLYATTPPSAHNAFMRENAFRLYVFSNLVETYKGKKIDYYLKNENNVVAIPDLPVNDAGGELGKWCTYYNGLANVTVPEGTTIYKAALNSTKSGVILTEVDGNIIKKGEAVLLKSADNITLTSAASSGSGDYDGNMLQGVDVSTPQTAGITYYVLSKVDDVFGFYKLADGTNLAANKAYLVIPTSAGSRGFLSFGNETTSLTPIPSPTGEGSGAWYSLDGRRLTGEPTRKGVYVRDGKKVVIK